MILYGKIGNMFCHIVRDGRKSQLKNHNSLRREKGRVYAIVQQGICNNNDERHSCQ